jgi:hypothetical protein
MYQRRSHRIPIEKLHVRAGIGQTNLSAHIADVLNQILARFVGKMLFPREYLVQTSLRRALKVVNDCCTGNVEFSNMRLDSFRLKKTNLINTQ